MKLINQLDMEGDSGSGNDEDEINIYLPQERDLHLRDHQISDQDHSQLR